MCHAVRKTKTRFVMVGYERPDSRNNLDCLKVGAVSGPFVSEALAA